MLIWFIHTPRTGGMSLAKFLRSQERASKINFLHEGHAKFNPVRLKRLREEHQKVIVFTILRDPVLHVRSLYSYIKNTNHDRKFIADKLTFRQWAREINNTNYVRFYGDDDLNKAIKNIKMMDYVLDTANLNTNVSKMFSEIGVNFKFDNTHINSKGTNYKITDEIVDTIKNCRMSDYLLLKEAAPHIKLFY